jgi:hypothetical protein
MIHSSHNLAVYYWVKNANFFRQRCRSF